jgi:hypothetical protein
VTAGIDFGSWAQGAPEMADDLESMEGGEGGSDPVWSGEVDADALTPEQAATSWAWLQEAEPEIADAMEDLFQAHLNEDETMIEHGSSELEKAEQFLIPEYPELSSEQRILLGDALAEQAAEVGIDADEEASTLAKVKAIAITRYASEDEESEESEEDESLEDSEEELEDEEEV